LRSSIERPVGLVDTIHGDLCDTRGELATPIILKHDGKDCEVGMKAIVRSGRHDGRAVAAFTVAETSGAAGFDLVVEATQRTSVHAKHSRREMEIRQKKSVRTPPHTCECTSRAYASDTLTYS
jgi:hypothetical protein